MARIILFSCLLFLGWNTSEAQYNNKYIRLGISGGASSYLGDLEKDLKFKTSQYGFGFHASYRLNPMLQVRGGYYKGFIEANDVLSDDRAQRARALNFRTKINEFNAVIIADFLFNERSYIYRPFITPYMFGGIAVFDFNPEGKYLSRFYELQPLGTEGQYLPDPNDLYPEPYKLRQIAIPFGIGLRIKVSREIDLEFETGWRKLFTDYLDDVSGYYPNMRELRKRNLLAYNLSDPSDRVNNGDILANEPRGQQSQKDWYIYTSASVNFILDTGKCWKPKRR